MDILRKVAFSKLFVALLICTNIFIVLLMYGLNIGTTDLPAYSYYPPFGFEINYPFNRPTVYDDFGVLKMMAQYLFWPFLIFAPLLLARFLFKRKSGVTHAKDLYISASVLIIVTIVLEVILISALYLFLTDFRNSPLAKFVLNFNPLSIYSYREMINLVSTLLP